MKVRVSVKTLTNESIILDLTASPQDTVLSLKEQVAAADPNPFPDQRLVCEGKELEDHMVLAECAIQDGMCLEFSAQASEQALVKQLEELLPTNSTVSVEELGLTYALKHGVTIGFALQALGKNDLLGTFLEKHGKNFIVESGQVKLPHSLADETVEEAAVNLVMATVLVTLCTAVGTQDVVALEMPVTSESTTRSLKERILAAVQAPLNDPKLYLGQQLLQDEEYLVAAGVADQGEIKLVATCSEDLLAAQMAAILRAQGPLSRVELDNAYCLRHGLSATKAVQMLGWGQTLQGFLEHLPELSVERGCVRLAPAVLAVTRPRRPPKERSQAYLDLLAKLSCPDLSKQAADALNRLAALLTKESFLNISHVLKSGAITRGTLIPGAVGAELVLFLKGLPPTGLDAWLPGLAKSVAAGLGERLCGHEGITDVSAEGGALILRTEGVLGDVSVLLSPVYGCHAEAMAAFRNQGRTAWAVGAPAAFTAQRLRFSEKQPPGVKATTKLMKWWRQQREWSSPSTSPSDELLELVVAHTVAQRAPSDLCDAVTEVLSVLSKFSELKVTWPISSRSYQQNDLCKHFLEQRPLLMDPASPFRNLADPALYQPSELMEHAASGRFF